MSASFRKPVVRFHFGTSDGNHLLTRLGKSFVDLSNQGWGRYSESVREAENHVQGGSSDAFLKSGHIAPFQTAITGQIRLAPSFTETPARDHPGKAGTELFGVVQAFSLAGSPAHVAVTIGPENRPLSLTSGMTAAQIAARFGISRANAGSTPLKSYQESAPL